METPLLQTKLYIPLPSSKLVYRQRLMEKLNDGLRRKLTLISAPAGFGKTTLISSWINQIGEGTGQEDQEATPHHASPGVHPSSVAWISLDERDNDPTLFWLYVLAALQTIDASLGKNLPAILESQHSLPLEVLVTMLINDLAEFQADNEQILPLLLVLDDYHLIATEAIHASLNFLIDHLPPALHLVVTTRSDPPLHLSQRRARSEITQIRAIDLSFTLDEIVQFFNSLMRLNLSGSDIAALESRTEGWIAGLQLAALSLQDQEDRHTFVTNFAGDDRYIADYLVDEVLHHQPPYIQAFLLRTSILGRLCASLCNDVTSQNESRAILTHLERANLFLTPLDNRREWYRYHQLFADLLRQRLQESSSLVEINQLHQQASKWYEERGDVIEAVEHASLAGDHQRVAQLIEQQVQEIFSQFKLNALSKWIKTLPDNIVADQPKLIMIYAWASLATGHIKEVEYCLQSIENSIGASAETITTAGLEELDPGVRGALIEVIVVRAVLAINRFNIPHTLALCQLVLPYLKDNTQPHFFNPPLSLRTVLVFNMGMAHLFSGNGNAAVEALTEAVTLSLEQENMNILPMAMAYLGQLQILQGHLHQAEKTYRQALQLSTEATSQPSPLTGIAEIGLGNLFYEWNDLNRAIHYFNAGIALAKQWNHAESLLAGYIGLARLKQAQGDGAGALTLLQELADMLQKFEAQMLLPAVDTCRARLWIAQGNLDAADRWLRALNLRVDGELSYLQENDYLTLSRFLIAQERFDEAEELISRLLDFAEAGERGGRTMEILMLRALVFQGQGKAVQAVEVLSRIIALAKGEGYVRMFVDEGPPMARLLYQAAENDIHTEYIEQLLKAYEAKLPVGEQAEEQELSSSSKIIEPLSDREIEVLQCIAEGLSNREIAFRLTISLTTVKSHTRNIYGKLEVNSRTQAVAKARAWGLLLSS